MGYRHIGGNAKCLGRDCLFSTEEWKNSSELSFHSSEVLFPVSVGNFCFLGSYEGFPPWALGEVNAVSGRDGELCGTFA